MATSLEQLLAEEGFKSKSYTKSRLSTSRSQASMPVYQSRDKQKTESLSGNSRNRSRIMTERTKSDVPKHFSKGESSISSGRRPRDDSLRRREVRDKVDESISSFDDVKGNEIVEIGVQENGRLMKLYSNKFYNSDETDNFSERKERYRERSGMELVIDWKHGSSSSNNLRMSFNDNNRNSMKQPDNSYDNSIRGLKNRRKIEDFQRSKSSNLIVPASELALDDVAIQAIISILSGHMRNFLNDEDFRTRLHGNCFSSLNIIEFEEADASEKKVIRNLEQAIEIAERAAEGSASPKDLKKASLQLSVITGLNSNNLKDGFTSGIPNSSLSACAHLYLSCIYKLQKKDRAVAKHLLQVFCDSPFQARKILLPDLWEHLFSPHLSHLEAWYHQQADSLEKSIGKPKKLKLLDEVYNEVLDSGTFQYATYYKDWLVEGIEMPSIPSIPIPSFSTEGVGRSNSTDNSSEIASQSVLFSPQSLVTKKLYDSVFYLSKKPDTSEAESRRSSGGSAAEVKQSLTYRDVTFEHLDQDVESSRIISQDQPSFPNAAFELIQSEELNMGGESIPPGSDRSDEYRVSDTWQETEKDCEALHAHLDEKANDVTLKKLAKSFFELQETSSALDLDLELAVSASVSSPSLPVPDHNSSEHLQLTKMVPSFEDLKGSYKYLDEGYFFSSIPQDFICPITEQLFKDPITLETGHTFEKSGINEWFELGKRTCPVTGKSLECRSVPLTNLILKRVVDNWKTDNSNNLLTLASHIVRDSTEYGSTPRDDKVIFVIEPLLNAFGRDEGVANAKHLISIGGLQFLICRFERGKLKEKARVAKLLLCFIKADASCRNQIAERINKQCLLELLHFKEGNSAREAVLLLIELICLRRRKDVKLYLNSLKSEELLNTMNVLLEYLQSSTPEEKPLVAILMLHIDILGEPQNVTIHRETAIATITVSLTDSLTDEKVRGICCRSLLVLGAQFSSSGDLSTELWYLKEAEIYGRSCKEDYDEVGLLLKGTLPHDDDEAWTEWIRNLTVSLIGSGKSYFLEIISKCISSAELELAGVCLTTVAWLSYGLTKHFDDKLKFSGSLVIISVLKDVLKDGQLYEHKVLASFSLLNFSKIPECRNVMMNMGEELAASLLMASEVSWAAKQLHSIICQGNM